MNECNILKNFAIFPLQITPPGVTPHALHQSGQCSPTLRCSQPHTDTLVHYNMLMRWVEKSSRVQGPCFYTRCLWPYGIHHHTILAILQRARKMQHCVSTLNLSVLGLYFKIFMYLSQKPMKRKWTWVFPDSWRSHVSRCHFVKKGKKSIPSWVLMCTY
jgi:hypothetical protein